ncbi:cation:proton antiporter [Aquisalimonas asiatica]|uniref:Multisubunit sodium/proton antiporter, MrpG subunit n=1 Tax=Aquisalimonas asiatica TaxID=406100 RepID=A0A1H8PT25_9GAMM|nr:monovalent cation/H(+) antiporter subunit G [Aquisalimonas asiatica]SEO45182.1 multisubunit sodium/proton antiporter, MrpG subunit [Aquisalimonas asiatica]
MVEWIAGTLIATGLLFFVAGTVGLLRFPDLYTRLHALTKADNTGLGLIAAGIAVLAGAWQPVLLIALIWFLAVTAASIACHLVARHGLRHDHEEDIGP